MFFFFFFCSIKEVFLLAIYVLVLIFAGIVLIVVY